MSNRSMNNKFTKFMTGRGFYAALALCLIGTGTAAWVAVDRTLGGIEQNNADILRDASSQVEGEKSWGFPTTEEAGVGQSGVTVSSPSSSSAPAPSSSSAASSKPQQPSASSAPQKAPSTSVYALPISGEILCEYSGGKLMKDPTLNEWRTHNGVDFKAPKGSPVSSIGDGMVAAVYNDPMWGWTVEITHGGNLTSIYCGLSKEVAVKKGQTVKLGQPIGSVDQCPAEVTQESHLHFGVKQNGKWVDPIATITKAQ